MTRLWKRIRVPMWGSLLLGVLLVGCASDPVEPAEPDAILESPQAPEPVTGTPNAPPFGAPRAKVVPGEVVDPEESD